MKKIKLFSLMLSLLSITNVWGYTITFSKGSGDGSTASTTTACSAIVSDGASYLSGNLVTATKAYYNGSDGLKLGASSNAGTIKMNLASNVTPTSIVVSAKRYNASKAVTLKVNGSTAQNITADFSDLTFSISSEISYIQLESSKYCWIESITVNTSSADPTVSVSPASWDFENVAVSAEASKVFSVSGTNLKSGQNLNITVPTGYSVSPNSITVSAATLAATNVTVSKNTNTIGTYNGNMSISGGGQTSAKTVALKMNVVADPEPTGTFELFSGDLEEGDYVVVVGGVAMTNTITSNRLANTDVTISSNKISNPPTSIIWHLAPSSSYWTFYNDEVEKYAASTGTKNQATLATTEDAKIMWTVEKLNGVYHFNNRHNTDQSINSKLQRNGTYGWACYADYSDIQLYKKSDGKPSAPSFSPAGGSFLEAQSVSLSAESGTTIHYTTDGSTPTTSSATYSSAIPVSVTTTIKAIAVKDNKSSSVASATYTIINLDHAGTAEDPYSVADAKKVIDVLGTKENAYVSGIVSSIYSTSLGDGGFITFYISADGATTGQQLEAYKCKSLNGEAFSALSDVATGATVVITGTLKKYNSTYEFDQNCHLVSYVAPVTPKQHIANDQANPYTVAQALVYAADGVTYDLDDYVYVRGVVYDVKSFSNGAMNIFIKDADAENQFELYKCAGINDGNTTTPFEALTDVQSGDIVIGYGQLTVYNTTYEFKQGNYLVDLDRPVVPVTGVTLESTASVAVGGSITLNASVVPSNASNKTINWSIQSGNSYVTLADGVVTGVAEGTAVIRATSDADATKYAECTVTVAPLSPWATVYTSNVELSGATASTVIINETEYDAMKAGTGSAAGSVDVAIPAQATTLHFHASGWEGKEVTLNITAPTGITVTPASVNLTADAGVSGNTTTYTLANDPSTTAYFAVTLSGNTDAFTLTFANTGSKKQFVLFGVNQEGGILPVLDHIVVTGDLSNKTFDAGDRFDSHGYAGLGANAIYTLAGVEQSPVAIDFDDIEWSSDPEVVGASTASVTVTATYENKSANKEVTGLTVNIPDPEIDVDASPLAFGKVAKGATVAGKDLTITLRSVENATLAISGAGASAFSVTPASLTATGTVTVSASSANVGTFEATLTISDNAGAATAQEVALSITVEAADDLSGTWNLVTDEANLMPGMQVIIASIAAENTVTTMGKQAGANEDGNNRVGVTGSSVSGTVLTPAAGTKVFTLVDAGDGKLAFQGTNGKYLYASSNSANQLKEQATNNANGEWTISIDDDAKATITAQGSNSRKLMRFNPNNGNPLFACYATNTSTGTEVTLYAKAFDYERAIPQGQLSTTCLPNGGVICGASIFEIAYMDYNGATPNKIYFYEVEGGIMEAGMPYVVLANEGAAKFGVYYTDSENKPAQSKNGLVGYMGAQRALEENDYFIYDNKFYYVEPADAASGRIQIAPNRAYIKLSDVPGYNNTPVSSHAPSTRVSLSNGAPQVSTGIDKLNTSEAPTKVIINGQLYILRGEKMFDATGRLVK